MPILNTLDIVWQKTLTLVVIFFVFYWVYRNLNSGKFKDWIDEAIEKFKGEE